MIASIIENDLVTIFFQPIISIRSAKVVGLEALMRVRDENAEMLSPVFVFEQAKKEGLSFELDKYVRRKALEAFCPLYRQNKELLLFLNFESYLLDSTISFNEFAFCDVANRLGISFSRIVLEIKEYEIHDGEKLKQFCDHFRAFGFLIALDDFGAGNSNFDRISTVRPHIVKVDRSIVFDVDKNFIHKEILKSITNMCFNIGALVLAEGVESEGEILRSLKLDIDLFQGFWFARPNAIPHNTESLKNKIVGIGHKHAEDVKALMKNKEELIKSARIHAHAIIEAIIANKKDELPLFLEKFESIEAIYCVDFHTGIQVGDTIISVDTNDFFQAAKDGDSHVLKEYFYITKESKRGNYLSQKYISRASGRMCRTFAQNFSVNGHEMIVCIDLKIHNDSIN